MSTSKIYEQKSIELSDRIIDTLARFAKENSTLHLPPQIVMTALVELFIQYSVTHAGRAETLRLISYLKRSVETFGGNDSSQH